MRKPPSKKLLTIRLGIGLLALSAAVSAQGQGLFDQLNFRNAEKAGFGLYGVSVFGGDSVTHSPYALPSLGQAGQNAIYGASASAGWQKHGEDTNAGILYSGSYGGLVETSVYNSFSQSLSLNVSWKLARKLTASFSASAQDSTLAQSLFQPLGLSVLSQVAATPSDFGAALGGGQFSSPQVASTLQQGAPLLGSPLTSALLGDRVISYSGNLSLSYSYSPRLSFSFSGFSAGGQNRYGDQAIGAPQNYVMPRTFGGNAGVGFSYSVSPRTQFGFAASETAVTNRYQDSYGTTATGSLSRRLGQRWFLGLHGGATRSQFTKQTLGHARTLQGVAGGSLGFKLRSQTLAASYDLAATNSYGFAVGTITTIGGSWSWRRPGSSLSLFSGFGRDQVRNTGYASLSGYEGSAGTSVNLGRQAALSAQYVYLHSTSSFPGVTSNKISVQSARLSLSWSPVRLRR